MPSKPRNNCHKYNNYKVKNNTEKGAMGTMEIAFYNFNNQHKI